MKTKKLKFEDRYVLGEGYPWADGLSPYTSVSLQELSSASKYVKLEFPEDLWKSSSLPKYRLVLEKVE